MSFAESDRPKVDEARAHLAQVKAAFYRLDRSIQGIEKKRKHETLMGHLEVISRSLDVVQTDLYAEV